MKVLILSIAPESSHGMVARFIKKYMDTNMSDCTINVIDALNYINPVVDELIKEGYLMELRKSYTKACFPGDSNEKQDIIECASDILKGLLAQKLKSHIGEFNPDVIITTHPSYLQTLSLIKDQIVLAPVVALITDFYIPTCWGNTVVDAYIIPHEDLAYELYDRSPAMNKIFPFGIPVGSEFLKKCDKTSVLKDLELENKLTILIMEEVIGPRPVFNSLKSLADSITGSQFIIISGYQNGIKAPSHSVIKYYGKKVKVVGYDRLSDVMSISDLLITKPDSLTVSEAMIKGLPTALVSTTLLQKSKTLDYLLQKGAVAKLDYGENMAGQILSLLNDRNRLRQINTNAASLIKPHAASDIANLIAGYVKKAPNGSN